MLFALIFVVKYSCQCAKLLNEITAGAIGAVNSKVIEMFETKEYQISKPYKISPCSYHCFCVLHTFVKVLSICNISHQEWAPLATKTISALAFF